MKNDKRYFVYDGDLSKGYVIVEGERKLCWTPYPAYPLPIDVSNWSVRDVLKNYSKELKKEEFYLWLSLR